MVAQLVDAVWFWPNTTAPFRAIYGRFEGPYSKDYLQTSGECSEVFDRKTGRRGDERYSIRYQWPGGHVDDVVKPGGGYNPPHDLRLNFRWPFSEAPAPWRVSRRPGQIAAFPGDPTKTTAADANQELARFLAGEFDPWLLAVKLRGEDHVLHVRAYMGQPPPDREYASMAHLPQPLVAAIRGLRRGGCGTYQAGDEGQPEIQFDPDRMFDAWSPTAGVVQLPPEVALILTSSGASRHRDMTGVSYEFPSTYQTAVLAGRPFVYY